MFILRMRCEKEEREGEKKIIAKKGENRYQ